MAADIVDDGVPVTGSPEVISYEVSVASDSGPSVIHIRDFDFEAIDIDLRNEDENIVDENIVIQDEQPDVAVRRSYLISLWQWLMQRRSRDPERTDSYQSRWCGGCLRFITPGLIVV